MKSLSWSSLTARLASSTLCSLDKGKPLGTLRLLVADDLGGHDRAPRR